MNLRFLHEGRYAEAHRALLSAMVILVLSVVVLSLPPSWGILGGQAGLVVAFCLACLAAARYYQERTRG